MPILCERPEGPGYHLLGLEGIQGEANGSVVAPGSVSLLRLRLRLLQSHDLPLGYVPSRRFVDGARILTHLRREEP